MTTFTVYDGSGVSKHAVGEHQCRLLAFAERYRDWHSFANDRTTCRAIDGLAKRGCIELNEHGQFRYIPS